MSFVTGFDSIGGGTKFMASTYQKTSMPRRQGWEGQKNFFLNSKKYPPKHAGAMDGFWKLKTVEVSLKFMPRMRENVL